MRSFRLLWRRQSDTSHTELVPHDEHARRTSQALGTDFPVDEMSSHSPADDAVLSLIGIGTMDRTAAYAHASARSPFAGDDSADALVDTLHAQYWRALTDPNASLAGTWAPQTDEPSSTAAMHETSDEQDAHGSHSGYDSIETMLSGERALEDVFGRLEGGCDPALAEVRVPEILRLFAPPEFLAATARHASALPPALTRREHHALSMDSPLAAPLRKDDE
ncbi:TagK domain-containing protein [Burkholderia sp. PU8-34]